ncbi:MAG TPA: UDP-N-acetylglucosamine 1-carboxyvinyltransferase [Candidatus Latescibacteria bacterium]|nr:UDP-N-acetylglucosamine 1-carboxyvinyltransferase [Candidatus Latescibacterota bacterium]HOS63936.1 UDP-N-acetylglucosamine 1-carboxyvinyltransferase [Candidatus Latescibacterota bacterium]HPK73775.1 UDP-N-acetylglucosamine 1-carboxyvinyltransferase [Candidatus Latescibacterota bacterium]
MDAFRIQGGTRLAGSVEIEGMKNAILPMMAASILATEGTLVLENVPQLRDVTVMLRILETLGVKGGYDPQKRTLSLDATGVIGDTAPYDLVRQMRASFLVSGALVARLGRCRVSMPGGCAIGSRPVSDQLRAFKALGGVVNEIKGYVEVEARNRSGRLVTLDYPAATGTENIVLLACLTEGTTTIENAACDPEVVDFGECLVKMGAQITGLGTNTVRVTGVKALRGTQHRVVPDRIDAATFAVGAAMTQGDVFLANARSDHFEIVLTKLEEAGAIVTRLDTGVRVQGPDRLKSVNVRTLPYPAFPTDVQAPMMAAMATAEGASLIWEQVYDNRFTQGPELRRMGANITIAGDKAVVVGVPELTGAPVMASDIRAGGSLVLAGLVAKGETTVSRVYHIDRGYDHLETRLQKLGAVIERYNEPA